jgi:hypothetical protein
MDPYLEGSHWTGVHAQLCAEIARQLTPRIVPKYIALTNERFVLEVPEAVSITTRSSYPDVGLAPLTKSSHFADSGAVAVAPLHLATVMPEAVPHLTVEIRDTANRQLVTAIEVLSPTNKRAEGRQEYLAKRQRILLSTAHLIEIDLLREGQRVPMQQSLPSVPYFVFLSRCEQRPVIDVYPLALDQRLPTVPVPLLLGDTDVALDLQQAFTAIYDALRYDLLVDYGQPPEVSLSSETSAWIEERLQKWRQQKELSRRQ